MRRFALYLGLATALMASCSIQEEDVKTHPQDDVFFYASFEQPVEEGTRVYANEDLLLRWTADDRVSIFNKLTYNQEYRFTGQTGANAGGFKKVDNDEFVTGNTISHVVSVYPYQESTAISEGEEIRLTLPAEQHYTENTFGLGANTMVSVSSDNVLQYKNVGGYLMLKLFGEGVSVSSITLKGNNGEKLAGKATVKMPLDGTPTVEMASDASTEITLTCDTPVQLGATAEKSTQFWFVIPPVTFSKGFTIAVNSSSGLFVKSTSNDISLERNKLSKMSPIEVDLPILNSVIYYTSSNGEIVSPSKNAFGATIVSNEYFDGKGRIIFDGVVTSIGENAFFYNGYLTSIIIPEGVKSIGRNAFAGCTNLESVSLPEGLISLGGSSFEKCSSLTSITLPESVTTIDIWAFADCTGLKGIRIPENVTNIGEGIFCGCESLFYFLGKFACYNGVFLINSGVLLAVAPKLMTGNLDIPEEISRIGAGTFEKCSDLTSISLPEGIMSIGRGAFWGCTSLTSITVSSQTPPIGDRDMFYNTNACPIYVPATSISAYKSAEYWSSYADRIQALPIDSILGQTPIVSAYFSEYTEELPDATLLTHINYAHGRFKNPKTGDGGIVISESKKAPLSQVVALKSVNPNLKVILSIGGWGADADGFSEMAKSEVKRTEFCQSVKSLIEQYELDGVDVDWEYPTISADNETGSDPSDTQNLNLVLQELRETLGVSKIISLESSSAGKYIDWNTAINFINYVNVMTYDMGAAPNGHNSPLHKSSRFTHRSWDEAIDAHVKAGVPPEKLVIGVPFYGKAEKNPAEGTKIFDYTVKYYEIPDILEKGQYKGKALARPVTRQWDATAMVPFLGDAAGKNVLSYDDPESVAAKGTYVKAYGLLGAMCKEYRYDSDDHDLLNTLVLAIYGKQGIVSQ